MITHARTGSGREVIETSGAMDHETITTDDYNTLPMTERERIGRFMELERIQQLRRNRKKAALLVNDLDEDIKRCLAMLSKWPRHEPPTTPDQAPT